jgi:hypothetical protein
MDIGVAELELIKPYGVIVITVSIGELSASCVGEENNA